MADLSLVGKSSTNFTSPIKSSKSNDIEGGNKFDLFCQEADKKSLSEKDEVKSDKPESVVRKLFDAVFSYRKAEGNACAPSKP